MKLLFLVTLATLAALQVEGASTCSHICYRCYYWIDFCNADDPDLCLYYVCYYFCCSGKRSVEHHAEEPQSDSSPEEVFNFLDTDKDGNITVCEWTTVDNGSLADFYRFVKDYTDDGNEVIDLEEFKKIPLVIQGATFSGLESIDGEPPAKVSEVIRKWKDGKAPFDNSDKKNAE